ncbi:FAD-dependent oxidoreductase [Kurthia senegalensis]|uniref:FAD-dependent oxidoreductase n=1 Tax=Kurthia senegalensis TaxID=1033740 RepID=UPI0002888A06|nr:FAD-dependent oxidoreductase [Kurthia senegalensis]
MNYVVIGGDAAGMSAAMEIYRHDSEAHIITLEKGFHYSYGQCGLPYVLDGRIENAEDVVHKTAAQFKDKYGIDTREGHCVTAVHPKEKTVSGFDVQTKETFEIAYDRLIIATGASPKKVLKDEAYNLDGIYFFKTIPQTKQLQQAINDAEVVTIIGGGYIALELAETLTMAGKKVRMLIRSQQVVSFLESDFAEMIHEELRQKGVDVLFNEQLVSYDGNDHVSSVTTTTATYDTDIVIEAVGVKPSTDFVKDSGIHMLKNGAIVVDSHMETNIPSIYAAGDCATHYHIIKGQNTYLPLGTTANKQGRIAGLNMASIPEQFKGIVGSAILKCFDLEIGTTGLIEKELKDLNIPYEVVTFETGNHAGYYPNVEKLHLKMYWHKDDQQLLGLRVIGKKGVDKRIDVFATALYHASTLRQLIDLDLSYAPPFNSVWDPIQQLAKRQF